MHELEENELISHFYNEVENCEAERWSPFLSQ
jgi:hypothetical protein